MYHLISTYYVLGTVLSALHTVLHLLPTVQQGRLYISQFIIVQRLSELPQITQEATDLSLALGDTKTQIVSTKS